MARRDHIEEALNQTLEGWKVGLLHAARNAEEAARESANRERWIIRIAVATLVVSIAGVLVALFH